MEQSSTPKGSNLRPLVRLDLHVVPLLLLVLLLQGQGDTAFGPVDLVSASLGNHLRVTEKDNCTPFHLSSFTAAVALSGDHGDRRGLASKGHNHPGLRVRDAGALRLLPLQEVSPDLDVNLALCALVAERELRECPAAAPLLCHLSLHLVQLGAELRDLLVLRAVAGARRPISAKGLPVRPEPLWLASRDEAGPRPHHGVLRHLPALVVRVVIGLVAVPRSVPTELRFCPWQRILQR
mmetsp:Transcript_272/g.865  ORF Transcript_272/g.865 Transcript_272/m.865 type:complete len:237 (-) Transcript_272:66-776(-)